MHRAIRRPARRRVPVADGRQQATTSAASTSSPSNPDGSRPREPHAGPARREQRQGRQAFLVSRRHADRLREPARLRRRQENEETRGSRQGSCESDIFVMNADGSNVRQLTDGPESDTHPTWSPDGQHDRLRARRPVSATASSRCRPPAARSPSVDTGSATPRTRPTCCRPGRPTARGSRSRGSSRPFDETSTETLEQAARSGDFSGVRGDESDSFTIHTYITTLGTGNTEPVGGACRSASSRASATGVGCQFDLNPAYPPSGARSRSTGCSISGLRARTERGPSCGLDVRRFAEDDVDIIDSSLDGSGQDTLAEEHGPCTSRAGRSPAWDSRDRAGALRRRLQAGVLARQQARIAFHSDRDNAGQVLVQPAGAGQRPTRVSFGRLPAAAVPDEQRRQRPHRADRARRRSAARSRETRPPTATPTGSGSSPPHHHDHDPDGSGGRA